MFTQDQIDGNSDLSNHIDSMNKTKGNMKKGKKNNGKAKKARKRGGRQYRSSNLGNSAHNSDIQIGQSSGGSLRPTSGILQKMQSSVNMLTSKKQTIPLDPNAGNSLIK